MIRSQIRSAVALSAIVLLSAGASSAGVRVIHASPDAPNVDVYVNTAPGAGAPNIANLAYRSATPYVALPTGDYRFRVTPAGATSPVVIDATAPISGSVDYTVAAINQLASISPLVLVDDNTVISNKARVRFVHASPNAPAVDVALAGAGPVLFNATTFGNVGVAQPGFGTGNYLVLDGGSYNLEVRLDSNNQVALNLPGINLQNGFVYTIFAVGLVGNANTPLGAQIFTDVPAPTSAAALVMAGLLATRRRR
jgi:hypothetical protein